MPKSINITSLLIDENHTFTLYELSSSCQVHAEYILDLVEHGLLEPKGKKPEQWQFSARDLKRSQKALRLQNDLQINLQGVALALDLLEEIDTLREQLRLLYRDHV